MVHFVFLFAYKALFRILFYKTLKTKTLTLFKMKLIFKIFILILGFFLFVNVNAQDSIPQNKVEMSKNKVLIGQQVFYVHVVKKGQTLYAIAKAYGVSQQQIIDENPEAAFGLRDGQAIKISESMVGANSVDVSDTASYAFHTVGPKETLYSIAKQYSTTIDAIQLANKGLLENGLKAGQKIHIPKLTAKKAQQPKLNPGEFLVHVVEPGQTLYSISKLYQVSVEDIVSLNDSSILTSLHAGSSIKIPQNLKVIKKEDKKDDRKEDKKEAPVIENKEVSASSACDRKKETHVQRAYNVAIMLPFYTQLAERRNQSEGEGEESGDKNAKSNDPVSSSFLEFYEGTLLAINQLKDAGISINLYVYDTERSTDRVTQLLKKPEMLKMDLIIGPLLPENIQLVAEFAQKNNIPVVSPISTRSEFIKNNPYVYQTNPSAEMQETQLVKYIASMAGKNVVLMHSSSPKDVAASNDLKNRIFAYMDSMKMKKRPTIKEASVSTHLSSVLSPNHENYVVFTTDEELFINNMVHKLLELSHSSHDITVIGTPKWYRLKTVEVDLLHQLGYEYCSSYYVDYNDAEVQSFITKYKAYFGYEPHKHSSFGFIYGFYGYDIAQEFIRALDTYGKNFGTCVNNIDYQPIITRFNFISNGTSGYSNNALSIIKYNTDYSVTRKLVVIE
jgi:LysM repeat protein/ABC-type branched-subunit amino acid transport system substrate-binding protein